MNQSKGIWKTAALALMGTLVFAVLVFNFADWTKELSSEFVYAQTTATTGGTGTTGTTGSGTGTSGTTLAKVIPHVVVGSYDGNITKYLTYIVIVNNGPTPVTAAADFYNTNGTASTLPVKTSLASIPTFTASLPAQSVASGNSLVLTVDTVAPTGVIGSTGGAGGGSTSPTGSVNWAKITTTGPATVFAVFEYRDVATNFLYTRIGLASASATTKRFIIPRLRNVANGLDVGFALVNTGTTSANITVTAKNSSGVTIGAPRVYTALPGAHTSAFANEFLSLTGEPAGTNYGYLIFESASATWAPTALSVEGGSLSSFPVDVLE